MHIFIRRKQGMHIFHWDPGAEACSSCVSLLLQHCVDSSFVPLQVLSEVGEEFISVRNARLQSFVGAVILGPLDDGGVLVLLHHGHPHHLESRCSRDLLPLSLFLIVVFGVHAINLIRFVEKYI